MKECVDAFVAHAKEKDLHVLYCQTRENGEVSNYWSRFSVLTRMESWSLSKTFVAMGVGIALDEGLLTLDEKVADSFPELVYDVNNPNALDITVENMLTMTTGLADPLFFRDHPERKTVRDWGRHFYTKGDFVRRPGEAFLYSNFNTYMLGCLVEKKCGQNICEYMRYRLFEPLGMGNANMTTCPHGHTVAANGLEINVDEMGRFAQMLLQKGVYNGKRIVSEKFVEKSLSPIVGTGKRTSAPDSQHRLDYGYQTWVDTEWDCCFLWGIFGQYCVLFPERNIVVGVLSLEEDSNAVGRLLWKDVITQI